MKKVLLSVFAVAGLCVNAQEVGRIDAEPLIASAPNGDGVLPAGTKITETANVVMSFLNQDTYKGTACHMGSYKALVFAGKDTVRVDSSNLGVTGSTNPAAPSVTETGLDLVMGGCQYNFDVKKDGYIYFIGKFTSNKNFYVGEYTTTEGTAKGVAPIGYNLVAISEDLKLVSGCEDGILNFTVPTDEDGYYVGTDIIPWPEHVLAGAKAYNAETGKWDLVVESEPAKVGKNGLGVIVFPVYADMSYVAYGTGTKVSTSGFVFAEQKLQVEAFSPAVPASEESEAKEAFSVKILDGATSDTALPSILNDAEVVGTVIYNSLGQQVSAPVKGVNIVKYTLSDGTTKVTKFLSK